MVSSTEPGYASRKSSSRCSRSTRVSPIGLALPSLCTENRLRRGEDCTRDRGKRLEALPRHPAADRRAKRGGKILWRKRIILDRERIRTMHAGQWRGRSGRCVKPVARKRRVSVRGKLASGFFSLDRLYQLRWPLYAAHR